MNPEQKKAWDAHYDVVIDKFKKAGLTGKELDAWKYQQYMRDYLRVITSVDRNVGRVLDYLEAEGLMDNTLIVYTSDQGFYMGEHGWFDKRWMYEESFRTPLIVRLPGGAKGESMAMVQNIDYAPTFLDAAGVDIPSDIHGCSFLPVLKGKKWKANRDGVYYHYYEYPDEHAVKRHLGVRTETHKLIHFYEDGVWELYDLSNDKHELNNIYGEPGTEKITAKLKKKLKKLQKQYGEEQFIAE
jgi:arylsulfatase A-like enzyme